MEDKITKVFISYSHDSEEHKKWVLDLSNKLRKDGIEALCDQTELSLGSNNIYHMNKIKEVDRILIIFTNKYHENLRKEGSGVFYENHLINNEFYDNTNNKKVIRIIRENSSSVPSVFDKLMHIDFSDDKIFENKYDELIRDLHGMPSAHKEPVGKSPFSKKITNKESDKQKNKLSQEEQYIQEVREKFKKLDNSYKYTLDISKKITIDEEMIQLFTKHKDIISRVYNPEQLESYINKIEQTSYSTKKELIKEILENYFISTLENEDNVRENRDIIDNNEVNELLVFFPDLNQFVKRYRKNYKYDEKTLSSFFDSLYHQGVGFLSKKHENILCNFKDKIKQEVLSNHDFFAKVINLIENSMGSSDTSCLKNIIVELETENDEYKSIIGNIRITSSLFEYKMR